MSPVARQTETRSVPPLAAKHPSWLPESLWHLAVDCLVSGQDYLLLVGEDWRIIQANDAFLREIASSWEKPCLSFLETITRGSMHELLRLIAQGNQRALRLELMHPVRGGIRTVSYTLRFQNGTWLAIGRDESVQLELVSQMATLISDLEVRVDSEKERSETLKKLAEKDPLTGLANRRELEQAFASHRQLLRENGGLFSVISIDIDRFKEVNDAHGHLAGDEVLKRVAGILGNSLRDGDCVARMGGEEFMVIAQGAALQNAIDLAERLRAAVESSEMPHPVGRVTISVGVSSAKPKAADGSHDVRELIQLADVALYEAKRCGRNCVRFKE